MRRALIVVVGFLAGSRMAFGCSCSSDGASNDAPRPELDAGEDVVVDSPPDPRDAADADDPDPTPPDGLPAGWEIDRLYSKHCGLYAPKAKENLPPPIRWEACPPGAMPSAVGCRLMVIDGEPGEKMYPGGAEAASVKADGTVVLGAYRSVKPNWVYGLVAEADGPVYQATLMTDPQLCSLAAPSFSDPYFTTRLYEHGASNGGGLVAGEITSFRPRLAIHLPPSSPHSSYAGPFAILDLTAGFTFDQYAWSDGGRLPSLWSSSQDNGLQQGIPVFAGGAAFWPSSNLRYHKVKVYSPATGVRDFLSAGMLTTRGFADLGTDGQDMVWIDAQGRTTQTGPFDTYTIMTAAFTTEPAQVAPRRLRTEEGPDFDVDHFFVGCGYAARSNGLHIRIVRLVDGQSWTLSNDVAAPWGWSEPLAVTCSELFATVRIAGVTRLARVRLDSLGPGIAPD